MPEQNLFNPSLETSLEKNKSAEITGEDKERYLKSILADRPYEETIKLFDGSLSLRFKAMTVQENSDVVSQIVADKKTGAASDTDSYMITISTYRLALCLVSIDDRAYSNITKENFVSMSDGDSYILARAKPMLSWQTPKLSIFLDAFQTFESKILKLTNEVQTLNFWKASA